MLVFCSLEAFCAIDGGGIEEVRVRVRPVGGSGLGMDGYRGGSGVGGGFVGCLLRVRRGGSRTDLKM